MSVAIHLIFLEPSHSHPLLFLSGPVQMLQVKALSIDVDLCRSAFFFPTLFLIVP